VATRALALRAAVVAELAKIGVTPASGWESGTGAPAVTAGRPPRQAITATPERQVWVQHYGTTPVLDAFTAAGGMYRLEYNIWLACPDHAGGEALLSKLERDVRRALQLGQGTLEGATLANAGVREGEYEARDELAEAGVYVGLVRYSGDYIAAKGDP